MAARPKLRELDATIQTLGGDHIVFDLLLEKGTMNKVAEELGVSRLLMYWWVKQLPERAKAFKDMREVIASNMLDEALDLADELPDINPLTGAIDSGWVSHQKNKVDTRKWLAARYNRDYADRPTGEITPDTVNTLAELLATIKGQGSQRLVQAPERVIEGEVIPTLVSQPLVP